MQAASLPGPFAHVAVAYGAPEEYPKAVLPLVLDGLRRGEHTVVIGGAACLELLEGTLGADFARLETRLNTDWFHHPARALAAYLELTRRDTPVLVIAEPVRGEAGHAAEWARIEAIMNVAFAGITGTAACVYREPDADTLRTHPLLLDGDRTVPNPGYISPELMDWNEPPFDEPPAQAASMEFDLPGVRRLREFVKSQAYAAGMERNLVASLVLAAAEIAANAVEHGSGYGRVAVWRAGGNLVCEITNPDGGMGVPFPGYIPPEHESPRGYGLWISRQLCDRMEVRSADGISRVRLHMNL
ncbi:anti-sigma factor RsbA family regulatory protein [Acrocarpospora catenulata]|uniref:anti-sigma factor RsbA family regulatory protein n=1 Tax=Acrocarpospora catenulata TaxID=2836182 RepID=UPI001BDAB9C0|nr:anti-sigma factor RsbA family regulatory protein [Acrocarpospora catenulata]